MTGQQRWWQRTPLAAGSLGLGLFARHGFVVGFLSGLSAQRRQGARSTIGRGGRGGVGNGVEKSMVPSHVIPSHAPNFPFPSLPSPGSHATDSAHPPALPGHPHNQRAWGAWKGLERGLEALG